MLQIKVADNVQVVDILPQGLFSGLQILEAVSRAIKNWVTTGMKEPLTITISPQMATGPPMNLGINVGDSSHATEAIRGG